MLTLKKICAFTLASLTLLYAELSHAQKNTLPTVTLSTGLHQITAEYANNDQTRSIGLMFRTEMEANHGMLFKFDTPAVQCMWMRNTYIPLSVAFIDSHGKIINIEDMQPKTEDDHCAKAPAKFALEMNLGWFNQAGLKPGSQIQGLDKLPAD